MNRLPPALADAVRERTLVVFCGAGVSMTPPSCLPDWHAFNSFVLDEARASALGVLPDLEAEARRELDALSLEALPVVAFSETLVRTFAGETWFPVLGALDSQRPNANHLALAELARRGVLRAIVSTNFDTLIERAFRARGVQLSVYEKPADYDVASSACALYKIHGSAKDAVSLVDTVTQKLRGLGDEVRATVAALASDAHLLFLGYSGADLAFSDDYLGIGGALATGRGVTWLLAPDRPVPDQVGAVVAAAGGRGAVVRGLLPAFFTGLGVAVEEQGAASGDTQAQADARARRAVSDWLQAPGVGPLTCAVYLTRLLSFTGRVLHAQALRQAIATLVDDRGDPRAQKLLHALAADAVRDGALSFAEGCLRREIDLGQPALATAQGPRVEVASDHRTSAEAWLQLAVCRRRAGRLDDARGALDAAVEHAEGHGLADVVAAIELEHASLAHAAGAHRDDVLARLEVGRRYALRSGAGDVLLEVELAAAEAYVDLAEYDCALEALERARRYARVSADFRGELRRRAVLAEIAVRRGDAGASLAEFEALVEEALVRGDRGLADRLRWRLCWLLDWHPAAQEQVLAAFDALLASDSPGLDALADLYRRSGEPSPPGELATWGVGEVVVAAVDSETVLVDFVAARPGIPPRERLRQLRADVSAGPTDQPRFLASQQDGDEARTRRGIVICEYLAPDPTAEVGAEELPTLFAHLCRLYHDPGTKSPRRLLDVATAQRRSSERVGDGPRRADALNWIGVAHDLAGEPGKAVDAYRLGLASDLGGDDDLRRELLSNLALALARTGSLEQSYRVFDDAISLLGASGDRTEEARARWNLAKTLLGAGEPESALIEARHARSLAEAIDDPAAVVAIAATVAQAERELDPDHAPGPQPPRRPALDGPEEEAAPELLGALALAEWEEGRHAAARTHCSAALAGYTARGDRLGVSKCLNNLAQFAIDEGDLGEAATLTRRALNLRTALGDVSGQLLTLANLADIEMHRHNPEAAVEAATRALVLAEDRLDEQPAFTAARTLVLALLQLGDETGAARAARRCLEIGTRQNAPGLAELREMVEAFTASRQTATPAAAEPRDSLGNAIEEANRLARLGDVDATTRVIENARASHPLGAQELGWLEGIRAVALQNAQRHEEAVEAYKTAAELLTQAGDSEQASTALQQGAASLRLLGRLEDSEDALRAALAQAPSAEAREAIATSLANTLTTRYAEQEGTQPAHLHEARELLTPIAEHSNVVEHRGAALVGLSNVDQLEGDLEAALDHQRAALGYLRRANSPHVDAVEAALRGLEEQAAGEADDDP